MKKIVYIPFILGIIFPYSGQEEPKEKLFTPQMQEHFKFYAKKVNHAYQIKNYNEGENIFTDFVNTKLTNTKFTNFKAKKLNGSIINIDQYFSKPLVLITYSSWCIRKSKSNYLKHCF